MKCVGLAPGGYQLLAHDDDPTIGMSGPAGSIADWTSTPTTWTDEVGFSGITVLAAPGDGKDVTRWGSGADAVELAYRVSPGTTQPAGAYETTIWLTAIAAP